MDQIVTPHMNTIDASIFYQGPVIVFRWRNAEQWPVEFVTPNVGELLGYGEDEFLQGQVQYAALVHPEDLARVVDEVRWHCEAGAERFQHADYRLVAKDGSSRWVEGHTRISRDEQGRVNHFLGYVLDVTARKAADASLRQREAETRAMLDALPDLLFKVDADGVFLDCHAHDPGELAMPPEAFLGRRMLDIFPESLGREGMAALARALATGTVVSHFYALPTRDRGLRDFEARYAPVGEALALVVVQDITEKMQTLAALSHSERTFRHLADNLPAIVYRTSLAGDTELQTTFFNDMVASITGYGPDELTQGVLCGCESFIYPEDKSRVMAGIRQAVAEHRPFELEYRILRKNGDIGYIVDRGRPVLGDDGEASHIDGVMFDISERKRAEEALHRFRTALDASADAIYIIDREAMRFVDANRMAWESLGLARDELLQLGPQDIKPEFDRETLAARFDAITSGEDTRGIIQTLHRRRDGSVFPVEVFLRPLRSGAQDMLVAVVRDVTERRQAEERLRESEARFKGIAESMSDWIWEVDARGVYTFCSGRVADILGYTPEEIIGRSPFDLMLPAEVDKIAAVFADICARRAPIKNLENWNLAKDGTPICLLTNGIPLLAEDGELLGYRGVDKDITNRKRAEETLLEAKLAAEEASRAKSEFLSRMSHELRTPLNAILGYTELLLDGGSDPLSTDQRDCLGAVRGAGRHLLELINEVLDLAKIEAGKLPLNMVNVAWHEVVAQCLELTRAAADKRGIALRDESAEVAPTLIWADELRLKQALLNLLSNAVKYNCNGGCVTLSAGPGEAGRLRITVRDTGQGLSAEELGALFQPFNRLSAEGGANEGVGIGLVISKRLLELMGGAIGVASTPGEGSTFWLELPAGS
jgi:PAS domain S-box-containing protein